MVVKHHLYYRLRIGNAQPDGGIGVCCSEILKYGGYDPLTGYGACAEAKPPAFFAFILIKRLGEFVKLPCDS